MKYFPFLLLGLFFVFSCSKDSGTGSAGGSGASVNSFSEPTDEQLSAESSNAIRGTESTGNNSPTLPTLKVSGSENQTIKFETPGVDTIHCGKDEKNFRIWAYRKVDENKTTLMILLNSEQIPRGVIPFRKSNAETASLLLITRPGDKFWAPTEDPQCKIEFRGNSRTLRVSIHCPEMAGVARANGEKEKITLDGDFVCPITNESN